MTPFRHVSPPVVSAFLRPWISALVCIKEPYRQWRLAASVASLFNPISPNIGSGVALYGRHASSNSVFCFPISACAGTLARRLPFRTQRVQTEVLAVLQTESIWSW